MAKPDKTGQLSLSQETAIDLLVTGKTDEEAAQAANVSRQTVNNWRNHDFLFCSELRRRRAAMWSAVLDNHRLLVLKAQTVLVKALDDNDLTAAIGVLKSVKIEPALFVQDPSDPSAAPDENKHIWDWLDGRTARN